MFNMTLYDESTTWQNLLPLTFVRSIADIRVGILTIREKYKQFYATDCQIDYCIEYLKDGSIDSSGIRVVSNLIPNPSVIFTIKNLPINSILVYQEKEIASNEKSDSPQKIEYSQPLDFINYPWDIFLLNGAWIENDYYQLTQGKKTQLIGDGNRVLGDNIFLEEGAKLFDVTLNASAGPIYIGKNAEIMEGSTIRGPFALGEGATIKMGAKIYGDTTIGPYCKVGGEVSNSVIFGYSNKGHDGFLGNSVIAEWCNLGADSNTSNLKNNYSSVEIYNYFQEKFIPTNQQFCGLIMGDYTRCAINTMFNTGSVVGICSNIFGGGFPSKHIPSFSWCSVEKNIIYEIDKAIETLKIIFKRRNLELSPREEHILRELYQEIQLPS